MTKIKIKSKKPVKPANPKIRDSSFPIVGLGASAGGLEAFEQFFRHAPADSGIAFVLVSHLDPGHASILTEILQRATSMPVVEAQDQMKVAPNCVYVIPPNREMTIFHGALQLCEPKQPHGGRMPIDVFLRSLAEDRGEQAIGVILSGTGTDGMPTSAIQGGYATHVLPVEKMPEALLTDLRTLILHQETPPAPAATSSMNRMLLRTATGHDFSLYKKAPSAAASSGA